MIKYIKNVSWHKKFIVFFNTHLDLMLKVRRIACTHAEDTIAYIHRLRSQAAAYTTTLYDASAALAALTRRFEAVKHCEHLSYRKIMQRHTGVTPSMQYAGAVWGAVCGAVWGGVWGAAWGAVWGAVWWCRCAGVVFGCGVLIMYADVVCRRGMGGVVVVCGCLQLNWTGIHT